MCYAFINWRRGHCHSYVRGQKFRDRNYPYMILVAHGDYKTTCQISWIWPYIYPPDEIRIIYFCFKRVSYIWFCKHTLVGFNFGKLKLNNIIFGIPYLLVVGSERILQVATVFSNPSVMAVICSNIPTFVSSRIADLPASKKHRQIQLYFFSNYS